MEDSSVQKSNPKSFRISDEVFQKITVLSKEMDIHKNDVFRSAHSSI